MKLTRDNQNLLNTQLLQALSQDNVEYEVVFQKEQVTLEVFLQVLKRLKSQGLIVLQNGTEELDISLFQSNLRMTLEGFLEIQNYWNCD